MKLRHVESNIARVEHKITKTQEFQQSERRVLLLILEEYNAAYIK